MRNLIHFIKLLISIAIVMIVILSCKEVADNGAKLKVLSVHNGPVIKEGDPGTEGNKYGFEGGTAFKYHGEYHMFVAERFGDPFIVKMKLAHWKSKDGLKWERLSTLFESSGNFTGEDKFASLWSPMPFFNRDEKRWNMFYVAYRSKPNDSTGWYWAYEGRVIRAISKVKGYKGFGGPYENVGVVLEPGMNDGPWEGLQGTDSFYAYQVGNKWYAFYGSCLSEITWEKWDKTYPRMGVGLATADKLEGPWRKMTEINPIRISDIWTENPIVYKLKNGKYIGLVDLGVDAFGYTWSENGLNWSKAEALPLDSYCDKWWWAMRTPLCLIPERDGTYTIFFTSYTNDPYGFATVGMAKVIIVEDC